MENDTLKDKLKNQVLIFDGAIGTELYKRHFFVNTCFDSLCLTAPKVVGEIHHAYYEAGAEVMTTNTYGANFNKLSKFGLGDKVEEINAAGARLAREASGPDALVAGSVGPIGDVPPDGGVPNEKIIGMLAEQIGFLEKAGVDFIMFETLQCARDVEFAFQAINSGSSLPYVISIAVDRHGESAKGEPLNVLLKQLNGSGREPTALGLNCGEGPEGLLAGFEKLQPLSSYPLIIQPNAGVPKQVEGRMMYMTSPEYLVTYAIRFVNMGARGIGGCCGTGPEHIREIAAGVKPLAKSAYQRHVVSIETEETLLEPIPMDQKSPFGAKLARGEWVTSVEIVPPRGIDLSPTIEKAKTCRLAGVDAINIPDGPRASCRVSPIISSIEIQKQAGIEVILHFCCRDKNLIGMQADLLGCAAVGVNNILFITGDPPKLGDYPFASAVFDLDSIGMVAVQSRMNRGIDSGGQSIAGQTRTLIGVGADPNAVDMKRELRRTREKVEAGAEYIITQPVFAVKPLLAFIEKIVDLKVPVIAGVWPLASYRNAEFMKNEVPGVVVPDEIMKRMASASEKEDQRKIGVEIAVESVDAARGAVAGIQVSAPFGNVNTAIEVIRSHRP